MGKTLFGSILFLLSVSAWATSPEDFYNAGMDLFKSHDYEKAVQYFHAAVEERPDYWQAYQFLGEAYYQTANRTEAVVAMEQSLKLHPNNPDLKKFLSKIRDNSPWASRGLFSDPLSIIAILLSLFTLGWTTWNQRKLPRGNNPAPRP